MEKGGRWSLSTRTLRCLLQKRLTCQGSQGADVSFLSQFRCDSWTDVPSSVWGLGRVQAPGEALGLLGLEQRFPAGGGSAWQEKFGKPGMLLLVQTEQGLQMLQWVEASMLLNILEAPQQGIF